MDAPNIQNEKKKPQHYVTEIGCGEDFYNFTLNLNSIAREKMYVYISFDVELQYIHAKCCTFHFI